MNILNNYSSELKTREMSTNRYLQQDTTWQYRETKSWESNSMDASQNHCVDWKKAKHKKAHTVKLHLQHPLGKASGLWRQKGDQSLPEDPGWKRKVMAKDKRRPWKGLETSWGSIMGWFQWYVQTHQLKHLHMIIHLLNYISHKLHIS